MSQRCILIDSTGRASVAEAGAPLGPVAGGTRLAIVGCPADLGADQLVELAFGLFPPTGVTEIPYERLLARRNGSCCGGACG